MPIYDYKCSECENFIEEFNNMSNRENCSITKCEKCNAENSYKLFVGKEATPIMPCTSIDGLIRPRGDFQERMKQLRQGLKYDKASNLKDHY